MDSEEKELADLRHSFQDLLDSLAVTPIIYDDGKDDGSNTTRPIWAGKPQYGPTAVEKANAITQAKLDEYHRLGHIALADSEPLDDILSPGESRLADGEINWAPKEPL